MYEKQIADLQLIGQQLQKNGAIAKKQTESQEKLSRSTNAMFDGLLRKTQIFQIGKIGRILPRLFLRSDGYPGKHPGWHSGWYPC